MQITKTELFTILFIVTPYIFGLFFLRHTGYFVFLGLLVFNAFFLMGCLAVLVLTKETKFKKIFYFLGAIISVLIFLFYQNQIVNAGDKIFFSLHRGKMERAVLSIEKARQEKRQAVLPQLSFASVDTLETGEIIFTLDGILDNCVGFAYSRDNVNPGYTNCRRIVEWKKFDENWYLWYTT